MLISNVTGCNEVDSELKGKLFYKGCPVPLPKLSSFEEKHIRKLPCIPGIVY